MARSEVYPENLTIDVILHSASGSDFGVYTLNGTIDSAPTPCPETSLYMIVCLDSNALDSGIIKGYVTGRSLNLIDIENTRYIAGRGFRLSSFVENTSQFNDGNYFNEGGLNSPNFVENSNYINIRGLDSSSFVDDTGYVVKQGLYSLDFIDKNVSHIIGEGSSSLDVAENTGVAKDTGHIIGKSLNSLGVAEYTGHIIGESLSSLGAAKNTRHIIGEGLSSLGVAEYTSHIIGKGLSSLGIAENTGHIIKRNLNLLKFIHQYYVVYRIDASNKLTSVRLIDKEVLNMLNIRKLVHKRICFQCRKLFDYPSQLKNHIQSHSGEKLYCRYKDCKTSFTLDVNRRRHEKKMHGYVHTKRKTGVYIAD
ncbi:2548_t:CDS:2 [Acaulospora morrowiae]|uniref:2548_t:CDS:1 n=1 Tax=Acaulospora morrowiae TaxID=94023 RepID=A0A9N9E647_9GLOM|nr:2548_t:CDS:2 [Acaulospora morrowiae]